MNHPLPSAQTVYAQYIEQRLPHFKGNPLIEALPPPMTNQGLDESLTLMPDFHQSQREWPAADRLMMLETLQNFMVPMSRHRELCRALDSLLRNGYGGRAPRTPGHAAIFQALYAKQMAGESYSQTADSRTSQFSSSLIGVSGMGKTTTVERWLAHLPKVIYHPDFNHYQIPALHIEMPSDGKSSNGLAAGILHKIDELLPGSNYYKMYSNRGRNGTDSLLRSAAHVMNLHSVGLLIGDEVQNLANSPKGAQTLMTELVSACNITKVPTLFLGTNKAAKVLGIDFRQSRRSSGHGVATWDRLRPGTAAEPEEWDVFLEILWQFQWVRNPVPLTPMLAHYMFDFSQGVIDLAIKLFVSAQARAIWDESERLTPELLQDVYRKEFQLLHPMISALRDGNFEMLCKYDDIAPLNLKQHIDDMRRKIDRRTSPLYSVKATDPTFAPRLATGLEAVGIEADEANRLAKDFASETPDANLAQGMKQVVAEFTKPKPVKAQGKGKVVVGLPVDRFDERPGDYRRAIAHAKASNVTVLHQLKSFGMAPLLEDVIEI